MKKVNIELIMVRVFQFVVFVVFTFIVLVYFGALLLVPLDIVSLITSLLSFVGLPGFVAALIGIGAVVYLSMQVYKIPGLIDMLVNTGLDLVKIARERIESFEDIVNEVKPKV